MSKTKTKYSTVVAVKGNEKIYLSAKDIEKGFDIKLDFLGYRITAL